MALGINDTRHNSTMLNVVAPSAVYTMFEGHLNLILGRRILQHSRQNFCLFGGRRLAGGLLVGRRLDRGLL